MRRLPYIDEHAIDVDAPAARVWSALLRTVASELGGRAAVPLARALGCVPGAASGQWGEPVAIGQALPGFSVAEVEPQARLTLEGRHRFSAYRLGFLLEDAGPGGTRLRAQTHATFPGPHGRAYRAAVIGTGAHRLVTRRLLRGVARRSSSG